MTLLLLRGNLKKSHPLTRVLPKGMADKKVHNIYSVSKLCLTYKYEKKHSVFKDQHIRKKI